jgi:hypothetical protein
MGRDGILTHGPTMARENARPAERTQPSSLAELRQTLDGVAMLAGWQLDLVSRARALLPDAAGGAGSALRRRRRKRPQR